MYKPFRDKLPQLIKNSGFTHSIDIDKNNKDDIAIVYPIGQSQESVKSQI